MTAPARLLSVRLQGFKSFAERTHVAFGPGISAIVGPNGSGKSNLADALRWALGEQGRALRSRKAEDVIWAGSERRSALGMADVQLVLDNADGLLPVEYGVVELGRRLYRSGENDYLLNRQRVRLRDLVDLLDSAHLAENAFLFIGQGMVDQALALRPEERRPLFEEVAGVRRHERRRRKAEEQLLEAEANLARVEDILAELRPQARRLAAQAEQQTSRRSAGDELAVAILAQAHARWHASAARVASALDAVAATGGALDGAMADLGSAEVLVATITTRLGERAVLEVERRRLLEAARTEVTTLRLRDGRVEADLGNAARDGDRVAAERRSVETDVAAARRLLAEPAPAREIGLDAELADAERALAEGLEDLAAARRETGDDSDQAAVRRLEAARHAELDIARRRLADAERQAGVEAQRAVVAVRQRDAADAVTLEARTALETALATEREARAAREGASARLVDAEAELRHGTDAVAALGSAVASARGHLEVGQRALDDLERGTFAAAARAGGGQRLDRGVSVEPGLRRAVDAALGSVGPGFVVERKAISTLVGQRGIAIVAEAVGRADAMDGTAERAFGERVRARGGGLLVDAIRRDDVGALRRLLARAAWLPDLDGCLELEPLLPPGWTLVPRDGGARIGDAVVALGAVDGPVERQAEVQRLSAEVARLGADQAAAEAALAIALVRVEDARLAHERARDSETAAVGARHRAEEAERSAARAAESATREASWLEAQAGRLAGLAENARGALASTGPQNTGALGETVEAGARPASANATTDAAARGAWEARVRDLRARRDRIATLVGAADARRQEADRRRAGAEASLAIGTSRMAGLDTSSATLVERGAALAHEREEIAATLAIAGVRERDAQASLDDLVAEDVGDRERLVAAEQAAGAGREAVRVAQLRAQGAEREELEARLGLEGVREQLLVELAGLGSLALRHLGSADGVEPEGVEPEGGAEVAADDLERTVAAAAVRWAAVQPAGEPPTPARLTSLRRRFHELGAGNPYAVDEYAALKTRLDGLESQRLDLTAAIERTRDLIVELDALIAGQFRTTFAALEQAFDARFQQLFGGGFAHLVLTDPTDLSATGIEIVARPPGKKSQALAMLSGGERALTAVALLFAMLEVRPVPFCVLDEVDAALDEANIGRFTEALRDLSRRTQCIVITHNRGTIETADALYGVTVGDDSVSRVISLRLEEATELATRVSTGDQGNGASADLAGMRG